MKGATLMPATCGQQTAPNCTACAEPEVSAVAIVAVPLEPGAMVSVRGLAVIEKSEPQQVTVTVSVVVCVQLSPTPVTVIV